MANQLNVRHIAETNAQQTESNTYIRQASGIQTDSRLTDSRDRTSNMPQTDKHIADRQNVRHTLDRQEKETDSRLTDR